MSNKVGYIDVDVSGIALENTENGAYYSDAISITIPVNAIPVSAVLYGSADIGVDVILHTQSTIRLWAIKSLTMNNQRKVRVVYYIP